MPVPPNALYQMLYVSMLMPDVPPTVIGEIARKSRVTNEAMGITGMLIFDGSWFCEFLEGEAHSVTSLMARMRTDKRHTDIQMLHESPCSERLFGRFSLGYTVAEDDALDALSQLTGQAALEAFKKLLPRLDREHG